MKLNPPRRWFGPKRIGWGYSPRTWEGWVTLAVFVAVVIALSTLVFE
ncbi:hypothetical protein [Rhodococcus sp. P1Y]|nr:hypothetical protein [Rhodococcus sp. P1Y]